MFFNSLSIGPKPFCPAMPGDAMEKKQQYGETLKEQLLASARDRLHRFLLADGAVRGGILHGTRMIHEMRANHELGILETLALGHAYLGAGLMAGSLKGRDRLSLQIECSGPIKGLVVEANAYGEVRGYLKNVPIPVERPPRDFNLSPFFGAGFLSVTRYIEDAKQPFTGRVALQYGTVAKDLANYYLASEQIHTAFNLSVMFDRSGEVAGAGGLFLQVMPGADDQTVAHLESMVLDLPSIGEAFSRGTDAERLVTEAFGELTPRFLGSHRVEFMCHCNAERTRNLLALLPHPDLRALRDDGPFPVELRCHHCNTRYPFDREAIRRIYGERFPNN